MNKRKAKGAAVIFLAFCIFAAPAGAMAKINPIITVQVYRAANDLILKPGIKGQIAAVEKYTFNYKGREKLSSIEKVLKYVDAEKLNPASLKWVSSKEKVADVNSSGTVTAKKRGSAYIYPVPRGVYSYKTRGKYIIYLTGSVSHGFKIYGGIGSKVKVTNK